MLTSLEVRIRTVGTNAEEVDDKSTKSSTWNLDAILLIQSFERKIKIVLETSCFFGWSASAGKSRRNRVVDVCGVSTITFISRCENSRRIGVTSFLRTHFFCD